MSKAEARLDSIDVYHASIPLKDYEELAKWTMRFRANLGLLVAISGIIIGIIAAVASRFIETIFHF